MRTSRGIAHAQTAAGPMRTAFSKAKYIFCCVGIFSGAINVLALASSFYMLQIYDRILPSQSVPTLVALTVLLGVLFAAYGILDAIRLRVMARVGTRIDSDLSAILFQALPRLPATSQGRASGAEPVRDLDNIRSFLSGLGPTALFDLPWMPIFLFVVFLLHPLLGAFAVAGALTLIAVTALTEWRSRSLIEHAAQAEQHRRELAHAITENAEAVTAMGLTAQLSQRWKKAGRDNAGAQLDSGDAVGGMGALSRVLRLSIQSGMLGLGAYLVILGEVSAGTIIAASITMSRALSPIETAIAHWRSFVTARQSHTRLSELFAATDNIGGTEGDTLPAPTQGLTVENLTVGPPGARRPTLNAVSFKLKAGDALGVIGPSASGKTTLARALIGHWQPPPATNPIRIDGAALNQWSTAALGRHIGYLPQDISLFDGTVAETIARCDPEPDLEMVIEAAMAAGCHDMILRLPEGYRTRIGISGCNLSAGQRQRLALARALFGKPFLVVLDEPNSNLDAEGERSLTLAIQSVRARGGIVIVIAHRASALAAVNTVLAIAAGKVQAFGPKHEVLSTVLDRKNANPSAAKQPPGNEPGTPAPGKRTGRHGHDASRAALAEPSP